MDSSFISPPSTQIGGTILDPQKKECSAQESSGSTSIVNVGKMNEFGSKELLGSALAVKGGKKKESVAEKSPGSSSTVKTGKSSVNKISSQIKKPPHRRSTSPLNWFPRKKTDSFLKRKIRLLQEVGGMNSSLDETLGDSYPHYCRVEREKIAAREAARKAMEARKAAMVEASWCRILRAARILNKEAESQLMKAEKSVTEAFEEAAAVGVIMYDKPDCPRQPCEIETSPTIGGGSTHTITASFETAFEVDKEVAAAVKTAFIRLAHCPTSSNKDEFQDLLRKISQNPDISGTDQDLSECESDHGSELESVPHSTGDVNFKRPDMEVRRRMYRNRKLPSNDTMNMNSSNSPMKLVDTMLDRLKLLQEDELASLATIVATCGLSAALLEENSKRHDPDSIANCTVGPSVTFTRAGSRRESSIAYFMDGDMKRKPAVTEVPSLDKFLVKHVSRLEREVQEAKNARKISAREDSGKTMERSDGHALESSVADDMYTLESSAADDGRASESSLADPKSIARLSNVVPDLGSILLKHTSRLEKEIEEAKKTQRAFEKDHERFRDAKDRLTQDADNVDKENIDLNNSIPALFDKKSMQASDGILATRKDSSTVKYMSRIERAKLEAIEAFAARDGEDNGLDKIFVKSVHRLEREKMQALASRKDNLIQTDQKKQETVVTYESLDKVLLVKHVSRLQKEKMVHQANVEVGVVRKKEEQYEKSGGSLDEILVKHQSVLEKEKLAMAQQFVHAKHSETRREARERELQEAWGGLSLGNSIRPHLSKLEREKAAWKRAEEEERMQARGLNC
ncbi:uncharacterized protein LOC131219007 [Magnolia sinica]|uniref:uncharacterized protein LOC131219007 n=1 Tax=Magnolia sinica TaxID=86752 RepID=UPI00265AE99C|nr:uncharacterized protein LOC131219007 [Magnolia sinica]XP_058069944.1 uncharacterized protein LOC131219007 [Magnolia sinica]XP_058069945.1 uncharacterized protein LOC131219007 [Magnolia sinica]